MFILSFPNAFSKRLHIALGKVTWTNLAIFESAGSANRQKYIHRIQNTAYRTKITARDVLDLTMVYRCRVSWSGVAVAIDVCVSLFLYFKIDQDRTNKVDEDCSCYNRYQVKDSNLCRYLSSSGVMKQD
jgi:hypothetical protein